MVQCISVHSLSRVRLSVSPWTAACQASLSIINSWSLVQLMPIESVMPSNHLLLCHPLLLLPSVFPSIRVFYSGSLFHIRWPKYWSVSFSISPSNEYSGLISSRTECFDFSFIFLVLAHFPTHSFLPTAPLVDTFILPILKVRRLSWRSYVADPR